MKKSVIILCTLTCAFAGAIILYYQLKEANLSFAERQIVCGLYFGMPEDSVSIVLQKTLQKKILHIQHEKSWATGSRPYYIIDFYNFDEFNNGDVFGHYGVVIPKFKNKRLVKCHVILGNFQNIDSFPNNIFFNQRIPEDYWERLLGNLNTEYGESLNTLNDYDNFFGDPCENLFQTNRYFEFSYLDIYHFPEVSYSMQNNKYLSGTEVKCINGLYIFQTKYGAIGAGFRSYSEATVWNESNRGYITFDPPQIPQQTDFERSRVLEYPFIEYTLDKCYYKSLGLEDPI